MTQQSLAAALHVTDKAVSKWERGLSLPDICLFSNLANVLSVSTSDLLLECSDEETPSHLVQIYEDGADIRAPLHIILGSGATIFTLDGVESLMPFVFNDL